MKSFKTLLRTQRILALAVAAGAVFASGLASSAPNVAGSHRGVAVVESIGTQYNASPPRSKNEVALETLEAVSRPKRKQFSLPEVDDEVSIVGQRSNPTRRVTPLRR